MLIVGEPGKAEVRKKDQESAKMILTWTILFESIRTLSRGKQTREELEPHKNVQLRARSAKT